MLPDEKSVKEMTRLARLQSFSRGFFKSETRILHRWRVNESLVRRLSNRRTLRNKKKNEKIRWTEIFYPFSSEGKWIKLTLAIDFRWSIGIDNNDDEENGDFVFQNSTLYTVQTTSIFCWCEKIRTVSGLFSLLVIIWARWMAKLKCWWWSSSFNCRWDETSRKRKNHLTVKNQRKTIRKITIHS